MPRNKKNKKKVSRWLYWTPRILSILLLCFLAIFSFDVFDSCNGFLECSGGLLMHNIPVFVLAILLWISWKHELVGAITFWLAGLAYIVSLIVTRNFQWFMLSWIIIIAGPAFIIGYLFYLNWKKK